MRKMTIERPTMNDVVIILSGFMLERIGFFDVMFTVFTAVLLGLPPRVVFLLSTKFWFSLMVL